MFRQREIDIIVDKVVTVVRKGTRTCFVTCRLRRSELIKVKSKLQESIGCVQDVLYDFSVRTVVRDVSSQISHEDTATYAVTIFGAVTPSVSAASIKSRKCKRHTKKRPNSDNTKVFGTNTLKIQVKMWTSAVYVVARYNRRLLSSSFRVSCLSTTKDVSPIADDGRHELWREGQSSDHDNEPR
jgi:hypothetical protein